MRNLTDVEYRHRCGDWDMQPRPASIRNYIRRVTCKSLLEKYQNLCSFWRKSGTITVTATNRHGKELQRNYHRMFSYFHENKDLLTHSFTQSQFFFFSHLRDNSCNNSFTHTHTRIYIFIYLFILHLLPYCIFRSYVTRLY